MPYNSGPGEWWIDDGGNVSASPLVDAEKLPGKHVLLGLVDAHAHASVARGTSGPVPLDPAGALTNLDAWRAAGISIVRDLGAPGSVTLSLSVPRGFPRVEAAGRFLAPAGQYYPQLHDPVEESSLVNAARTEIARGAHWVKVIADFPRTLEPGASSTSTYTSRAIAGVVQAAHAAGARVAAHSTIENVVDLIGAGVDSIEHGFGMTEDALQLMAGRGVAWTPTLCARFAPGRFDRTSPEGRRRLQATEERTQELLRLAVRLSVPILTGTDVAGSVAGEVAQLVRLGLDPADAIAAATTSAYGFLGLAPDRPGTPANVVTYKEDPLGNPEVLLSPAAVVIGGVRVR